MSPIQVLTLCVGRQADKGLLKGAEHLKDTESDLCTTFAEDYLTVCPHELASLPRCSLMTLYAHNRQQTQGLLVGAAFSIVVVNALLRTFMSCTLCTESIEGVSWLMMRTSCQGWPNLRGTIR